MKLADRIKIVVIHICTLNCLLILCDTHAVVSKSVENVIKMSVCIFRIFYTFPSDHTRTASNETENLSVHVHLP